MDMHWPIGYFESNLGFPCRNSKGDQYIEKSLLMMMCR